MIFQFKKRELWDRMLPFLANPIERIVYTDSLPDEVFCISGVNALSEYSMLNKEKNDTYAIAKEEARRLQIRTDKEYGETRIEIWRYNPCFFSKNGIVDKLVIGRHSPACFFKRVIVTACGHLGELLSHRLDFPNQFVLPSE